MRLLLSDADFGQHVENRLALDFQFPGQIVDSNLTHPPFLCSHRSLSLHRALTESALHSLPALARAARLIRFTVLVQRSRLPLRSPLQERRPRQALPPSRRSLLIPDFHLRLAPLKPLLLRHSPLPQTLPGAALPLRWPVPRLRHHRGREVIIDRQADFFHRLRADPLNCFQLLRRHIGQRFHGSDPGSSQLLDQAFAQPRNVFQRRGTSAAPAQTSAAPLPGASLPRS